MILTPAGINDVDQGRIARANAIRRTTDYEMIVSQPNRVLTDETTHEYLRQSIKAHGARRTILILTRKDVRFAAPTNVLRPDTA